MTLFEIAWMKNLIMQNYRRRMRNFILSLISVIIPIVFFIYFKNTIRDEEIKLTYQILTAMVAILFAARMLFVYKSKDDVNDLPWSVRNRQLDSLQNCIKDGSFEDLKFSVPLQEYFD
jgi:multidrug transporter EmrE-like cation transporter